MPFPFRLERCDIHNDAAARVGRLAQTNRQDVARNTKVLNCAGQCKLVGRDNAFIPLNMDEAVLIKVLRVNGCRVNIRKHLELA